MLGKTNIFILNILCTLLIEGGNISGGNIKILRMKFILRQSNTHSAYFLYNMLLSSMHKMLLAGNPISQM